jgi:hypothetical protein
VRCHSKPWRPGFWWCQACRRTRNRGATAASERQHKFGSMRCRLVPKGLSENSPVRSAGISCKKRCPSRKGRSKHSAPGFAVTSVSQATIYRPCGTGRRVESANPALRTGLLSSGPSGTDFLYTNGPARSVIATPFKLTQMGGGRTATKEAVGKAKGSVS